VAAAPATFRTIAAAAASKMRAAPRRSTASRLRWTRPRLRPAKLRPVPHRRRSQDAVTRPSSCAVRSPKSLCPNSEGSAARSGPLDSTRMAREKSRPCQRPACSPHCS
jgi:hypothetical protein